MQNYFKGYVNFNCDQCGLWKGGYPVYTNPFTVANSWESYYTSEWPYIQTWIKAAAALGIQNGLLAGTWANSGGDNQIYANSVSGSGTPSYKSMLDWSYANGIGFTSFHVWCGDNPNGLSQYKSLGFDKIVAALQVYYPPTASASLGTAPLASAPAVCAQNSGSLNLFINGNDGALYYNQWDSTTGWSAPMSLGGYLTSGPAAVTQGAGAITVFGRGGDGALWEKTTTDGGTTWSNWISLGGQIAAGTGPAACSWNASRLDVFVQGTDGALWHRGWTGTSWSSWQSLGGKLTSSPAATSPADGAITVFVRGGDGALWERDTTDGGTTWSNWISLGGQIASGTGPAACSWNASRLDVFVQGTDGALWHRGWTGTSWSSWQSLGGKLTSSPAATSPANGAIDVFVRGSDNGLWENSYDSGSWSGWTSIGYL